MTPEEENGDDAFFAKSFALNSRRRKSEQSTDAFAEGLRSLFDDSDDDIESDATFESDSSRFQRESEAERRESLDGVLRQEDADFLSDAGRKYEPLEIQRQHVKTILLRLTRVPIFLSTNRFKRQRYVLRAF